MFNHVLTQHKKEGAGSVSCFLKLCQIGYIENTVLFYKLNTLEGLIIVTKAQCSKAAGLIHFMFILGDYSDTLKIFKFIEL